MIIEFFRQVACRVTKTGFNVQGLPNAAFPLPEGANAFDQWNAYAKSILSTEPPATLALRLIEFKGATHQAYSMFLDDGHYVYRDFQEREERSLKNFSEVVSWLKNEGITFDATNIYYNILAYRPGATTKLNPYFDILQKNNFLPDPESKDMHDLWRIILSNGRVSEAKLLLAKGFKPEWDVLAESKSRGYSPEQIGYEITDTMLNLVKNKSSFSVLKLFDKELLKPFVSRANSKGETALHEATRSLIPEYVEYLLGLGADKTLKNKKGQTPFDCIKRTKSKPAELEKVVGLLGTATDKKPEKLFRQGMKSLDCSILKLAVQKGGNLKKYFSQDTLGFFHDLFPAIPETRLKKTRKIQEEMALYLMDEGILELSDKQNNTALHYACKSGAVNIAVMLVNKYPHHATQKSVFDKTPAEFKIEGVQKFPAYVYEKNYKENILIPLFAKNQQEIAKAFIKEGIIIGEKDFPSVKETPSTKAWLEKAVLKQGVGEKSQTLSESKRKM